jgi:hypothetical protein
MTKKLKLFYFLMVIWFCFMIFPACLSIPREAPELSAELGKRISAIEDSHISLLRIYMDERRSKVDEFIMIEWTPLFAKELFQEDIIRKTWSEVCASGTEEDRVRLMTLLGPKIQQRINKKRLELVKPLDDLERSIERRLRDEYTQAKAVNNSITSFLASAAKVAENRDRYLNMLGLKDQTISNTLDQTNKAVLELSNTVKDKVARADIFVESINKIMEAIKH